MRPEHETVCALLLLKMRAPVALCVCKTALKPHKNMFTYSKNAPENLTKMGVSHVDSLGKWLASNQEYCLIWNNCVIFVCMCYIICPPLSCHARPPASRPLSFFFFFKFPHCLSLIHLSPPVTLPSTLPPLPPVTVPGSSNIHVTVSPSCPSVPTTV